MSHRKTIKVEDLVDRVNKRNRLSVCGADQREGWNSLIAAVLSDANQYDGFTYLKQYQVPEGQLPGIIFNAEDHSKHEFPDTTRVQYFVKHRG